MADETISVLYQRAIEMTHSEKHREKILGKKWREPQRHVEKHQAYKHTCYGIPTGKERSKKTSRRNNDRKLPKFKEKHYSIDP